MEIKDSIKNGDRLPISSVVPLKEKSLIVDCWLGNPKERPSYSQILSRLQNNDVPLPGFDTKLPRPVAPASQPPTSALLREPATDFKLAEKIEKRKTVTKRMYFLALSLLVVCLIGGGVGVYVYLNSNSKITEPTSNTTIYTTKYTTDQTSTKTTTSTRTISRTPFPTATVSTLIRDDTKLESIYGITVDDQDNVYVISPYIRVVYKLEFGTQNVTMIADLSSEEQGGYGGDDQGICYFNNSLYVPRMGMLTKIDLANGNLVTRFTGNRGRGVMVNGPNGTARFCGAVSCTADEDGNIYVGETCNAIRKVTPSGSVTTVQSNLPIYPIALVINKTDLLFTNWNPNLLYSINLQSQDVSLVAGNETYDCPTSRTPLSYADPLKNGQGLDSQIFCGPSGLAFDELGNLYVSETGGRVISKVNSSLIISAFAGSSIVGFIDDTGPYALFNYPRQIVFDSRGRLLVADQFSNAIRMINW